jgi:Domain of unknown function (DUF4326)
MFKPRRIQLRRTKGWRKPANTVVVARPGKWGNPFKIESGQPAKSCVEKYACWLRTDPQGLALTRAARRELKGKNLACWCALGQPCHSEVLLEIANAKSDGAEV